MDKVDRNLGNIKQDSRIVSVLDFTERKNKRIVNFGTIILTIIILMVFTFLLEGKGLSIYWLLLTLISLVLLTPVHELCHWFFQWIVSRKKPRLGWASSFPYSALAEGTSTTRDQGIICALAPLVILTTILILISTAFTGLPRFLILASAAIEVASCFGDMYLIGWFLKHRRHLRWSTIDLANVLYEETD